MNLIYIFADQWRRDAMGIYNPKIKTPNLDKFASQSVIFDRAYSSCPLCSPNRASLLTGKQPGKTNVFTNCKPDVDAYLKEDTICVSDILKDKGYRTGYIGKWHLDKPDGSGGWDAYTPPGKKRHSFDFWYSYGTYNDHFHPHYWDTDGKRAEIGQWSPEHETDVALRFIEANKGQDFVLFLSYNPPHPPYELVPERYESIYSGTERENISWAEPPGNAGDPMPEGMDLKKATRQYLGAVTGIDENIGRILAYLKKNGLYEDTYIMISADHGDMLGDHQLVSKHIWFEGSVGIPLMIGGGGIQPMRTQELVSAPDQTATILGLLGITVPDFMDGKDFTPLVQGKPFQGNEAVVTMAFPNTQARIDEYAAHGLHYMDFGWRSVVTGRYKLAVNKGQEYGLAPQTYLYDLKKDPGENTPIDDPVVLEKMLCLLRQWCEENGDCFMETGK